MTQWKWPFLYINDNVSIIDDNVNVIGDKSHRISGFFFYFRFVHDDLNDHIVTQTL